MIYYSCVSPIELKWRNNGCSNCWKLLKYFGISLHANRDRSFDDNASRKAISLNRPVIGETCSFSLINLLWGSNTLFLISTAISGTKCHKIYKHTLLNGQGSRCQLYGRKNKISNFVPCCTSLILIAIYITSSHKICVRMSRMPTLAALVVCILDKCCNVSHTINDRQPTVATFTWFI